MTDIQKINSNPVLFTGAGPGDPDLITVKGMKALNKADLIIYAGSLVPKAVLKWAQKAECINSASLHLDEIIDLMKTAFNKGKNIVRLHTGDPSLYGAIFEQMAQLDKNNIPYKVIPGVTAAFAAAAGLGIEYTLPEITQTLILTRMAGRTPVPESETLERLASHGASMAIYLSITLVSKVQKILVDAYGKDFICAIAYKVSHPEERFVCVPLKNLAKTVKKEEIRSQALIVVSKSLNSDKGSMIYKSKLYDKSFSHEYRK
ncbi:precorrin-4 C(11)-methyltransferase [Desulfobacula sp.]